MIAAAHPQPFDVTSGTVLRLAVPMMLAYISTPLVGAVDTAVIGQLGQAAPIGGIAIAAIIFDVLFATFNFLRGGTTGLTAQAVGAGDRLEQASVLLRAILVALAAAFLIILLQQPIAAISIAAMDVEGEVARAALAYFFVRVWSAPFALVNYAVLGWVLGRGESGAGLLLQTLLNGVNIALTMLFVLVFGWGVAGAAWGTLAAEAVAAAAGLALAAAKLRGGPLPSAATVFDLAQLRRMMAVNGDMMIRSFVLLFAFALFARQGAAFGEVTLAGNAILMTFFLVGGYFLDGFATAAEQLAGRAVGARFRPAFDTVVRLTTVWAVGTGIVLSLAALALGSTIIAVMTTAPEVREAARAYLAWAALTPIAGAIAFQMDGIFIGATWSRDMRNMMLLSVLVYLVALAILPPAFGNGGLWAALLIFLGARSVAFHWRMRRLVPATFPA